MKVWMRRPRGGRERSPARSMSSRRQRASAATIGRRTSAATVAHRLGVGLGGDREARFDHVHAERVELAGELQLLGHASSENPGACSPSRSVVSKIVMRSAMEPPVKL